MQLSIVPEVESSRVAQAIEFYRRPLEFLEHCARDYGDCFTLRLPALPGAITFISDPEAVKQIFAADGTDVIESGSVGASMMEPVAGKYSMLILDGKRHRRHRTLIMPFFARGQFARFGEDIIQLIDREIEGWPQGTRFPIRPRMQKITLQGILRVVFGARADHVLNPDVVRRFFGRGPSPLIFARWAQVNLGRLSPWGQFLRLRDELYRCIRAEMQRRHSDREAAKGDILDALIDARDDAGNALEEQEIIDEIFTLIIAGNDTTATALAWAVYHICHEPEVLAELRRELAAIDPKLLAAESIPTLPYLDATVREVLRISPIFAFALRRLRQPMRLGGYDLPAGALIAPCIYLLHRRPDLWEEPARFRPKRFLEARHPANHFLPFGGGIRHCLGAALATYEMKLVLARIVAHTELKLDDNYVPRPRWIGNFLGPSKDMPVRLIRRADPLDARAAS